MKIMHCPMNGPRNISEFTCFGPINTNKHHHNMSDEEWCQYLFYQENKAGVIREWWRHTPSNYFFIAERHTITDEIVATYRADAILADLEKS